MNKQQFRSNAESIKYYVRALLDSEPKAFTRKEIENYLRENDPKGVLYSAGTISGALRSLTYNSKVYVNVERGKYQRVTPCRDEETELSLRQKVEQIIIQTKQQLKESCHINALYMTEDDMAMVDEVRSVIHALDETLTRLKRNMF